MHIPKTLMNSAHLCDEKTNFVLYSQKNITESYIVVMTEYKEGDTAEGFLEHPELVRVTLLSVRAFSIAFSRKQTLPMQTNGQRRQLPLIPESANENGIYILIT